MRGEKRCERDDTPISLQIHSTMYVTAFQHIPYCFFPSLEPTSQLLRFTSSHINHCPNILHSQSTIGDFSACDVSGTAKLCLNNIGEAGDIKLVVTRVQPFFHHLFLPNKQVASEIASTCKTIKYYFFFRFTRVEYI